MSRISGSRTSRVPGSRTSRILTVARADARRAVRSRLVWGAIALLAVLFLPSTGASARPDVHPFAEYLLLLPLDLVTYSLVVVAAVGYTAVVGERVAGTVRFVLGLPATRRDLVLGKLLSRAGIAALALVVILVVANVQVSRGYGDPHLLAFWVMGAWMVGYVAVWSAVTVGYSAAFDSPFRTLGALVATYVGFSPDFGVWPAVVRPLFALAVTGSFDAPAYETLAGAPAWLQAVERLNPLLDFWYAMRWSLEAVGPGTPAGGPLPHLLGTGVFLAFGALPLAFGLARFERTDLGDEQSGRRLWARLRRATAELGRAVPGPDADDPGGATRRATPATGARSRASRVRRLAVADLRHALQNWVITGALLLTCLLLVPELWQRIDASGIATGNEVLGDLAATFVLPVLVLGVAVGHDAVVGERTRGTVRFVLGLPATRRELVLSKLLSRVGTVVAALLPLLLFAELLVGVRLGPQYLGGVFAWGTWTLLLAGVWTAVVVGVSAAVETRYRSLAAIFGTYLLFDRGVGLWDPLVRPVLGFVVTGRFSAADLARAADPPVWFTVLDHLDPFVSLETLRQGLLEVTGYGTRTTGLAVPVFLYSLAVVLSFAGVSLLVGTVRFERRDLG